MTQRLENLGLLTQKENEARILHVRRSGLREQLHRMSNPYTDFDLLDPKAVVVKAADLEQACAAFDSLYEQIKRLCAELGQPVPKFE